MKILTKERTSRARLIQLIHIAKTKLGMEDDIYRIFLAGLTKKDSCADMNEIELDQVLVALKQAGFRAQGGKKNPLRPGDIAQAPDMISRRQAYYIKGLFDLACRATTEAALRKLIARQTGVDDLRFVPKRKASAVILMLRDICRKAGFNPDSARYGGGA